MAKLDGNQRAILHALVGLQLIPDAFISETQIAEKTYIDAESLRTSLLQLEESDYISIARTTKGFNVYLEPKGRQAVAQAPKMPTAPSLPSLSLAESVAESASSEPSQGPQVLDIYIDTFEYLTVTDSTPALIGLAIDVSGSMLTAMMKMAELGSKPGGHRNRLNSVLDSLKKFAGDYLNISFAKMFAYGFGFRNRTKKFKVPLKLFKSFFSELGVKVPDNPVEGEVRDLFNRGLGKPHADHRRDLLGATQDRGFPEKPDYRSWRGDSDEEGDRDGEGPL